jgi:L-threonylcarbamoyladenylate synthase
MIRLPIDRAALDPQTMATAAQVLSQGGIVGFPTDTLYGLAVDPRNERAVHRLCRLKGRQDSSPIPLIAADRAQVEQHAGLLAPLGRRLADAFWPGPLTLVVPAWLGLARGVSGLGDRVAIRVPNHVVACELARQAGHPVTSTSANRSGEPAPATVDEFIEILGGGIDLVLDAGPTPGGLPSTIVDVTGSRPVLVRAGVVAWARVLEFV